MNERFISDKFNSMHLLGGVHLYHFNKKELSKKEMTSQKTYFYCDLESEKEKADLEWEAFIKLVDCAVTGRGDPETKETLEEWKKKNRLTVPEPKLLDDEDFICTDDEWESRVQAEQELDTYSEQSGTQRDYDYEDVGEELLSAGAGDGNIWHYSPPRRSNIQKSVPTAPIKKAYAESTLGSSEDSGLPELLSQGGYLFSPRPAQQTKKERFEESMRGCDRPRLVRSETLLPRDICSELAGIARADSTDDTRED